MPDPSVSPRLMHHWAASLKPSLYSTRPGPHPSDPAQDQRVDPESVRSWKRWASPAAASRLGAEAVVLAARPHWLLLGFRLALQVEFAVVARRRPSPEVPLLPAILK